MSGALQAVFQNQRSFNPPPGQEAFITAGTFTWVAPTNVTSVSVVAVGGGGGRYTGAKGAVRIIWPGNTRSFPSTCTGNL